MAPVMFGVNMGVHSPDQEKLVKKEIMKIPGVVEVIVSLFTGRVAIVGMADPATLRELLATELGRPVVLVRDFGAPPAPWVGGGYGAMAPPPWPAPSSRLPAPPPASGYYYTPFGGRPWGPH